MNFKVQSEELRKESGEWAIRKTALTDAKGLADDGISKGYNMGYFARQAGLDTAHDTFISNMVNAFGDGVKTFDYMVAALASAANAYDGVDSTVVESANDLKKRLPNG